MIILTHPSPPPPTPPQTSVDITTTYSSPFNVDTLSPAPTAPQQAPHARPHRPLPTLDSQTRQKMEKKVKLIGHNWTKL